MNSHTGPFAEKCPCGKPWDLSRFSSEVQAEVERLVSVFGEFVTVHVRAEADTSHEPRTRMWFVSRRCIAYHGITGQQLLDGKTGFKEGTGSGRGSSW